MRNMMMMKIIIIIIIIIIDQLLLWLVMKEEKLAEHVTCIVEMRNLYNALPKKKTERKRIYEGPSI